MNIDRLIAKRIDMLTRTSQQAPAAPEPIASVDQTIAQEQPGKQTEGIKAVPSKEDGKTTFDSAMETLDSIAIYVKKAKMGSPVSLDGALSLIEKVKGNVITLRDASI
jgi:hypothetical protein